MTRGWCFDESRADFDLCRKKKKKSHSSSDRTRLDSEVKQSEKKDKGKGREERVGSEEVAISVKNVAPGEGRKMTDAERRFEETQRLRVSLPSYHLTSSAKGGVFFAIGADTRCRERRGRRKRPTRVIKIGSLNIMRNWSD